MSNFPILPTLYATPAKPITESRIERVVEQLTNVVDAVYMDGPMTHEEYETAMASIKAWADRYYVIMKTNATHWPKANA